MRRLLRGVLLLPLLALLAAGACDKDKDNVRGDREAPGGPGPAGARTPIADVMVKLGRGPQALSPLIGQELQAEPPPWETIQPQAKEFAELTASLAQYDPPKGSKESWAKLTAAYAESAAALDRAAQAREQDAAVAAHSTLAGSCMACHRQHRVMGPGGR